MIHSDGTQLPIGETLIDGEKIEFVWAPGTSFITAQFMAQAPRGIANLTRIDTQQPRVVPLSNKAWLTPQRESALLVAGRACFAGGLVDRQFGQVCASPAHPRHEPAEDRNTGETGLFNQRRATTRTR